MPRTSASDAARRCDLEPRAHQVVRDLCVANVATLVLCRDGAEALFQIGRLSPDLAVISAALPVVAELETVLNPLLARARARWDQESVISFGGLEVDSGAYEVRADGKPVKLTLREFELLRLLVLYADRVVTPEQIRREVWQPRGDAASANTIAVHIRRIRAHLDGAAELLSVRGVGYRLVAAADRHP